MRKRYEIDMCSGPILKKMLLFALPLMLSSMLQLLFNAADIIVVGNNCGDNSLAAVGSNTALINLLTNVFIGLSIGANVLMAKFYGAGHKSSMDETLHSAMLLSLVSGIILTVVGEIFARQLLILMRTPAAILDLATVYLRIYFIGMPSMMVYNFGSAVMRAVGDTQRPLYFLLAAGVINVALNLLLVICFKMDVAGVAIATVISQTVSAALVVICMMRDKGAIHFEPKRMRLKKDKVLSIIRVGLPAGFQGSIFSLSNVFIQSSINTFGEVVVAGNSAAANIEGFVYMGMNAFHHATLSFTGQNMGAGKYDRIKRVLFTGLACVSVTGLALGWLAVLFGKPLLGIYTDNPAAVEAGMVRLLMICGPYMLCGLMDVMVGSIRGMGYAILPMSISLIGACGLRLVWLATVYRIPGFHTTRIIYMSYPVTWAITFLADVICFALIWHIRKKRRRGNAG
ncbi:MAG: MATE family efflux transporter [Butyrivibrio sp.]|nr:MATE family efflux transporter [Butyrivibrio sp.]